MTVALILAAGQGTRLYPHTANKPKCLVEFMGKPLIQYQIDALHKEGIKDIRVATGYKAEKIDALKLPTYYNKRYAQTNMVESLFAAKNFLVEASKKKEDLILSYGDIIYEDKNLKRILSSEADISLMIDKGWKSLWSLRNDNPLEDAETYKEDIDLNILEVGKKPKSLEEIQGQYTGLIKVTPNGIETILNHYQKLDKNKIYDGKDFPNMYMTSFLQSLIDTNINIKAVHVEHGWLEIDTVSDLELYTDLAQQHKLSPLFSI